MQKLRERQLFDLADAYLDEAKANKWLSKSMLENFELEKLYLMQDSVATVRGKDEQDRIINQLETRYLEFLKGNPNHERNNEARMKLADLYLSRGQLALTRIKDGEALPNDQTTAQRAFEGARKLFTDSLQGLRPRLEKMRGAQISRDDREGILLRSELQNQYRQAEILKALAAKFIAESFANDDKKSREWYEICEKELTELVNKTTGRTEAGRHTLALLYRGQVQSKLGKTDEAYDSLIRVADIEAGGVFRNWRAQATADLVRLLANEKEKKYEAILPKAETALEAMQEAERFSPEWLELQFAYAEGRIAWSEELAKDPQSKQRAKNIRRDARRSISVLAKKSGPQRARAAALLASLGGDNTDENADSYEEIKPPTDLANAVAEARKRIQAAEEKQLGLAVLKQQSGNDESRSSQIEEVTNQRNRLLSDAIQLLQQGLSLADNASTTAEERDKNREEIASARYLLSFALLRSERFWEAAAASEFLTESALGSASGLQAGQIAMVSFRNAIDELPQEMQGSTLISLEMLVQKMLAAWPNAKQSSQWVETLLGLALKTRRWDDAERYLQLLPESSGDPGAFRRELGFILWTESIAALESAKRDGSAPDEADLEKKQRAIQLLESGIDSLTANGMDQRAVQAINSLASARLEEQNAQAAIALLEKPEIGTITVLSAQPNLLKDPNVALNAYRIYLQSLVMRSSQQSSPLDIAQATELISKMQSVASSTPNGARRVSASLVILGRDLNNALEAAKTPNDKKNLAGAISVLLGELASVSSDPQTLNWAGSSLNATASQLTSDPNMATQVSSLYDSASKAFSKLSALAASDAAAVKAAGISPASIELKLAITEAGKGDYQSAITKLTDEVLKNPANLTAQIEIARAYQAWGMKTQDKDKLKKAMLGAERKGRSNQVWGWGKIGQKLFGQIKSQPRYLDYFFDARLNQARCRYNIGLLENDAKTKKNTIKRALADVSTTLFSQPNLLEHVKRPEYESLTRKIQQSLGQTPGGLESLRTKTK